MDELREIRLDLLDVDPVNPRDEPGDVTELADSIAGIGLVNPLIVRPRGTGRYGVLSGSRRRKAATQARLEAVPCIVKYPADDGQALAIATAENLGRSAMNPIEEARAFKRLQEDLDCTQQHVAALVGVSDATVSVRLQLLGLPEGVQAKIAAGELTVQAAYDRLKRERRGDVAPTRKKRRTAPAAPAATQGFGDTTSWMPAGDLDHGLAERVAKTARNLSEEPGQLVARAVRRELREPSCQACELRPALVGIGRPTTCGTCRHARKAAS